ncbi:MAG TPA: CHASE4 domain-containing protein, partial [Fibrobacteria bacterium]|nr:CHASE4 domain-containing protein [Fibrobacteria bacterium]
MKSLLHLRWRTLGPSLIAIWFLVMLSGWIGTSRLIWHFQGLERSQVAKTRAQAERSLEMRLDNLRVHGVDWSRWDDAVSWLAGDAPDFPTSNLDEGALATLDLDALYYWDARFRRIDGVRIPDGGISDRELDSLVRRIGSSNAGWTGIVRTDSVLLFCTVQPVLPSSGEGVTRGWLAMARRVDRREDSLLSAQMQAPTRILAHGDTMGVSSWGEADSGILAFGYPILDGDHAIVEIRLDRPMMVVGRDASRQFLLQLLLGLGLVVALALAILERFVLSRIARLAYSVSRIRHQQGEVVDLVDPRHDELGNLSRRIQEMVDAARDSREKLETALDRAETSSRARMNFLQSMTHELRTPLNGVIGLTEIALKGELESEAREALELSRSAALGLLETINGVLEFSRLEKGEVDLVPEETDPVEVLLDASKLVGFEAERKGLDFLFMASPTVPSRVLVDPARLRRIFVNLAGNAVKYTLAGKVVVTVSWDQATSSLAVSVRDTGIGIPADRMDAIFQPFVQADRASAIRFGGTGLGLPVARALATSTAASPVAPAAP